MRAYWEGFYASLHSNLLSLCSFPLGSLALQSVFFRLGGCLNATIGGCRKISKECLSLVSVLQCFVTICGRLGWVGWCVIANTDLSVLNLKNFFSAALLSFLYALMMAPSMTFLL